MALGCLLGKVFGGFGGFWRVWRVLKGVEGLEGFGGFASLCLEACLGLPRGLGRGAAAFSLLSKITSSLNACPSTASGVSSSSWAGPMSSSPLQHCGHRSHFGSMYTLGSCCKGGLLYFSMSQTSKTHSFHLDNHLLCLVPKLVTTRCSAPVAA